MYLLYLCECSFRSRPILPHEEKKDDTALRTTYQASPPIPCSDAAVGPCAMHHVPPERSQTVRTVGVGTLGMTNHAWVPQNSHTCSTGTPPSSPSLSPPTTDTCPRLRFTKQILDDKPLVVMHHTWIASLLSEWLNEQSCIYTGMYRNHINASLLISFSALIRMQGL